MPCKKNLGSKFKKRIQGSFFYFYKDSESAIKLILPYVQFEKSVPKIYEFFGKNSIFRQKNVYISKTTGAIIKNSTPIVFFCDFTYDTKISS